MDLTINPGFRQKLEEITDSHADESTIGKQIQLIKDLKISTPHSISLLSEAVPGKPETYRYTCFQHALDLTKPSGKTVKLATVRPDDVYISAGFVNYLVTHHLTEVSIDSVIDGDLIIYYDSDSIKHAGKTEGKFVLSKWGTGHLWRHSPFEVPAKYGKTVRVFRGLQNGESERLFHRYARNMLGDELANRILNSG